MDLGGFEVRSIERGVFLSGLMCVELRTGEEVLRYELATVAATKHLHVCA